MGKRYLLLLVSFLMISIAYAQDQIIRKSGQEIKCKITSVDSTKINLIYTRGEVSSNTNINLKDVSSYTYDGIRVFMQNIENSPKNSNTMTTPYVPSQKKIIADSIEDLNKHFIYTNTGEIIFGKNVDYEKPFLGSPFIQIDTKKFQLDKVEFYKNETGFYANTANISFSGSSAFSQRIRKGKINLYEKETTNYSPGHFNSATGMYSGGFSTKKIKYYYNIGFGELKKANYKNLCIDLANKPESVIYLNKYKLANKTQIALTVIGGALIVGGFATLNNKTSNSDMANSQADEPNISGNLATICIGAGCVCASYIIYLSKPKHLKRAIDLYNN